MSLNLDEPVFLLTCGRTGSMLVQRMLNTHKSLHIWGEHGGSISSLIDCVNILNSPGVRKLIDQVPDNAHQNVINSEPLTEDGGWSIQWYNQFEVEDVDLAARKFIEALFCQSLKPSTQHWGFKEIRYGLMEAKFLCKLFPKAQFLLLMRRPAAIIRSQLHLFYADSIQTDGVLDEEKAEKRVGHILKDIQKIFEIRDSELKNRCLWVYYEDIISSPKRILDNVAQFLDIPSFDLDKILVLLNEKKAAKLDLANTKQFDAWLDGKLKDDFGLGEEIRKLTDRLGYSN